MPLVNGFNMDKDKIIEIVTDVENKSNNDLFEAEKFLYDEFEKTKSLIVELTHHLESVEESYLRITKEIKKRTTK